MILSFYERARSPWVWVQYAADGGKRHCVRTTVRATDPAKRAKLARIRTDLEMQLANDEGEETGEGEGGWKWVTGWISASYGAATRTRAIYLAQWRRLAEFIHDRGVDRPAQLTRQDCFDYVPWRAEAVKEKSGRHVKVNTAIGELKLLALVLDEAKVRKLVRDNPARKLGIDREETAEKPEITDAELATIFAALREEWMRRSFLLALHTGLRFASTRLHRSQVAWDDNVIHIDRPKGGRGRAFSIPIYERIAPLLREWWDSGAPHFWTAPVNVLPSIEWTRFFRRIKLPHLCFHCTRVTFISRGARAGIPEGMMMKLVNHASQSVHRVYQRLAPSDAARLVAGIPIPIPDVAKVRSRKGK